MTPDALLLDAFHHFAKSGTEYELTVGEDGVMHVDIYDPEWNDLLLAVLRALKTMNWTVAVYGFGSPER